MSDKPDAPESTATESELHSAEAAPAPVISLAAFKLDRGLAVPPSVAKTLKRAAVAAPLIGAGFALLYAGLQYLEQRQQEDDEP